MTLVEQLEAKHSECDALTAQLASAEEKLAAVETLNTDLASKVSALEADKTTFDAKLLEVTQASAAALDEEKAARVKIEGEHETLKHAVALNPAFAQAAATGMKTGTPEGGSPQAEEPMTKEEAIRVYNNMPDGMEGAKMRAEFRAKHKELLGL